MLFLFLFLPCHQLYLVWRIHLQVHSRPDLYGPLCKLDVLLLLDRSVHYVHHECLQRFGPYNCLILGLAELPRSLKRILYIIPGYPRVYTDALLLLVSLFVRLGIWRLPLLGLCSVCLVLCLSHLI